jgi:hypothetical protein
VRYLLRDDEMFLANYGDALADADLPAIARASEADVTASSSRCGPTTASV